MVIRWTTLSRGDHTSIGRARMIIRRSVGPLTQNRVMIRLQSAIVLGRLRSDLINWVRIDCEQTVTGGVEHQCPFVPRFRYSAESVRAMNMPVNQVARLKQIDQP